jgi:TonB-dependent receptor
MDEGKRGALSQALSTATLLAMLLSGAAWATGSVAGIVLNGVNGAPVPGALLEIEAAESRGNTDLDGLFRISAEPGTHVVRISKAGFAAQRVAEIAVTDGQVTEFSVVLMPSEEGAAAEGEDNSRFAEAITVTADASAVTESALLLERKQAAQISDLIGKEEFAKNPGGDAAGVLMRVTGVSVQDGKYVYVRGLGDRYSNTTLNGSKLPSTEFERKVVPLDLFPSDLLDKVSISKSYSAKLPGEFAAGSIDLKTRQFPPTQTFSIGISASSNSESTGKELLTAGDGLSFSGGGGQPIPSSIPDEALVRGSVISGGGFTPEELEQYGEQLVGTWAPKGSFGGGTDQAPTNYGLDVSYGNTFGKLGVLLSAMDGNDFASREESRNYYSLQSGNLVPFQTYGFDYSTESVKQGAMANLALALTGNHRLELRSIYTGLATSEGRTQEGFSGDFNTDLRDYRVSFQNQEITNLQLRGEHYLSKAFADGSLFEWRVGQSDATTEENRREALYLKSTDGRYLLSNNAQSGFMFFDDLEDKIEEAAADWSTFVSGNAAWTIQAGWASTQNDRDFAGRRLRFFHRGNAGIDLTLPPEQLFVADNIRPTGFEIEEITRPTDTYVGDHAVDAAYVQVDAAWKRWRLIGGVRYEDSLMEVTTLNRNHPNTPPIVTELDEQETPFSLSLVYQLQQDMNLRLVASRTVNRPAFRELAPFTYTHIVGGYAIQGNPDLVSATIQSYDLRWEWFPGPRDLVAVSLFQKSFDKPIEQVVIPGADFLETFANAESAENYGVELELRRNLGSWLEALEELTVVFNYTYVSSEIEVDPGSSVETNAKRPLVGQPDNVLNAVLEWDRPESGSLVRLLFNLTGDKVATAGAFGLPNILEDERRTVDLIYLQELPRGLKLKLSGRNLTHEEWSWSQGGEPFRVYKPGRTFGLGLSWSL